MKIINTSGKRKSAVARATLKKGKGTVTINNTNVEEVTPKLSRMKIMEPLYLADTELKKVDISVKVFGGGMNSQAEAARLAIARAFVEHNKELEKTFLDYDRQLLVADVRRKETYKPNDSKARAKRQKSYR